MATFSINSDSTAQFKKTINAEEYRNEGEYFVFYDQYSNKVYSVATKLVSTIERKEATQ